jgi:5-(carboxyamino)imidazole ribonucleotide mutase
MDSLLAMVQMPGGIPVPTFAIGEAGAKNAALTAAAILSLADKDLEKRLLDYREDMRRKVESARFPED